MIAFTILLTILVAVGVSYVIYKLALTSKSEVSVPTNRFYDPTVDEEGDETQETTCWHCGNTAAEAYGTENDVPKQKLKRCSRCMNALYCSQDCLKAAWPIHKTTCNQTRKLDIFAFAPLFASCAHLVKTMGIQIPNLEFNCTNPSMRHQVLKKELKGNELVLTLGPPGKVAHQPSTIDASGDPGPTGAQLHMSILADGHAASASLGILFAFQQALTLFNSEHDGEKLVQLAFRGQKITEYGLAMGRSMAPWSIVYKYPDGSIVRRQALKKHTWMYFACEDGKTEVLVDVSATSLGGQMGVVNALDYIPEGGSLRKIISQGQQGRPSNAMMPAPLMVVVASSPSADGEPPANPPQPFEGMKVLPQEMLFRHRLRIPISKEVWDRRQYKSYHQFIESSIKTWLAELQEEGLEEDFTDGEEEDGSGRPKGYLKPDPWNAAFTFFVITDETIKAALKEEAFTSWPLDGYLRSIAVGPVAPPHAGKQEALD